LTDDPSYKEEDYSKCYERSISALNENKQEVIMRISKLLDNDHFLIPVGQKSSKKKVSFHCEKNFSCSYI
jgi:hypothetical protein